MKNEDGPHPQRDDRRLERPESDRDKKQPYATDRGGLSDP
jgi:hypothetical protein